MKLLNLIENVEVLDSVGSLDIDINEISINSEKVNKNDVFICLDGKKCKGDDFVHYAIKNGAKCIISEKDCYLKNVTFIKVKDTRKALSIMAKNFYDKACDSLEFIFVVGTNGKSTTAYLIHELLKKSNIASALIGTMYVEYNNKKLESNLTTPDPIEMHKLFYEFRKENIKWVIMEVSAHAIYLNKTFGINAKYKVFTNLSQDHLDYFRNMQEYKECKKSFFMQKSNCVNVINADDKLGIEIINQSKNKTVTYGINNPSDVFAVNIEYSNNRCKFVMNLLDDIYNVSTNLFGLFNVYNTLASIIVAKDIIKDEEKLLSNLSDINPPEGRFNLFLVNNIKYIVDFAHTPDGLFNLIKEARKITKGKIITIFGCGGDRDISKRPIMGKIASAMSDKVIITSDNSRSENALEIIEDISQGIVDKDKVEIVIERDKAIRFSYLMAKEGDVVLVAGKGSEKYMEIDNKKLPYSDIEEVLKLSAKY